MKVIIKIISTILSGIMLLSISACSKTNSAIDLSYFNTSIHIETHDSTIQESTLDDLNAMFARLENSFDISNPTSLTAKFNSANIGESFTLSSDESEVLMRAKSSYILSDGKFNPAVYPLTQLWQFVEFPVSNFTLPSADQINACKAKVSFDDAAFNLSDGTLVKKDQIKLDFGGIVKGYAADLAAKILVRDGHEKGYVNVGGSSLNLLGVESLSVRHPRPSLDNYTIISIDTESLENVSVSTSGDYEKYYTLNGKKYCHIIDAESGYPTDTGVASVTLIGIDGAISDALTTAACIYSHTPEDIDTSPLTAFIKKIIAAYPDCLVFAVYDKDDIKQIITNADSDSFTILDKAYDIKYFN